MSQAPRFRRDPALERRLLWLMLGTVILVCSGLAMLVYFLGTAAPR